MFLKGLIINNVPRYIGRGLSKSKMFRDEGGGIVCFTRGVTTI